ncbi:MAG: flagellin hook IN motif-containing protein, partial [Dehalococcoidia bacterium]|nr:flagellin hook IN motif-containing protein [Dehalococcoidia bacterium]
FSAGELTQTHTASTTVSHAAVEVDANATFNNADTSLRPQFDGGAQVTAGSFTVNGTSITVNANDTVNAVLARITASAAGVTATLANDKITLTTNSSSEADIVLAGDTSGFLSAVKLASATTTRGNLRDDEQALSQTTQFGSVASGSFTINGVSISVDKDADTLAAIITRINGAGAGVTASYDSAQDKLILTTTANSEDLITVAGDTTGFLTAAKLSTNNTARGNLRDDQQVLSKTTQFATVSSGSFTVNGVSITVNASTDTLTTLVDKINDADAGVTASYDATLDKLVLIGTSYSADLITVAGDTTGFLTTATLSTGNTVRGKPRQDQPVTSQPGAVASGRVEINGKLITVDVERDPLATLVDRINKADAGVTASFNAGTNTLMVSNAGAVARDVATAVEKLNEALAQLGDVRGAGARRSGVEAAVRRAIGGLGEAGARGVSLSAEGGELHVSVDRAKLAEALGGPLGEQADPGGALGGVLAKLTAEMSTPDARPAKASGPRGRSAFQRGEELKAQLTVDQLSETFSGRAKSLLARYLEGSKERRESDPPERPRDPAYW